MIWLVYILSVLVSAGAIGYAFWYDGDCTLAELVYAIVLALTPILNLVVACTAMMHVYEFSFGKVIWRRK